MKTLEEFIEEKVSELTSKDEFEELSLAMAVKQIRETKEKAKIEWEETKDIL